MTPYGIRGYGATVVVVAWVEFAVCLVLLVARIYTTWSITRRAMLDLYFAIFTFVAATLSVCLFTVAALYGLGQQETLLTSDQRATSMKWAWASTIVSLFAISSGKFAIVAFLHQLHGPQDRGKIVFLWTLAGSNFVANIIAVGTILGSCVPPAKLWDPTLQGGCHGMARNQNYAFFQGSWSAFVDLALAVYPVIFFYHVQLQRMVKVALCVLMGLGVIAAGCAIVKTVQLSALSDTENITYHIGKLDILTTTEMWIILIVGCVPPIRPLIVKVLKKLGSTIQSYSGTYTINNNTTKPNATELQSFHVSTTTTTHNRRLHEGTGRHKTRNDSEEDILMATNGIMKVTDINVTYYTANGAEEHIESGSATIHSDRS
ncbi:hypothetical protein ASPZODRAFT_76793 [Penicilliopsis zonata CBS 506.65]|uniref:Rhodopsin domain-containing protein n=1 Tax=Penicilliopsis zonata CBS 506.65 TaxID=1073090 RepID=A0A1L9S5M5_9EURO|nr:hypothetical protein ASPZODRAFT_76793 [Penicilliopsis zonata CBS 506.65]OJJ42457.1 hypothetical protein ASPZODRAFT_76793 [Penicilliopsis zonata CBS 506.65]